MESLNVQSSRTTEIGFNQMKSQLNETIKQLHAANAERDAAHQELVEIRDKTRKLLFKLNLSHDTHDIESTPLALEHARDMVYQRRSRPQPLGSPSPRLTANTPRVVHSPLLITSAQTHTQQRKCLTCGKYFSDASNYEGACVYHLPGARKLYPGTKLEVWSCCKSRDTFRGCQLSKHKANS